MRDITIGTIRRIERIDIKMILFIEFFACCRFFGCAHGQRFIPLRNESLFGFLGILEKVIN